MRHGGPSHGGGDGKRSEGGPHSDPQSAGRPAGGPGSHGGGPSEKHETSGHPGASSQAEAEKEGVVPGEKEGMAAQTVSRVKSLARGLMEKAADAIEAGVQTASEKLDEMAKAAPKIQERLAKKAVKAQPNQAWRLIGASSCFLKDRNGAVQAWNKLDTQGRSFLKYVCSRNAITVP